MVQRSVNVIMCGERIVLSPSPSNTKTVPSRTITPPVVVVTDSDAHDLSIVLVI